MRYRSPMILAAVLLLLIPPAWGEEKAGRALTSNLSSSGSPDNWRAALIDVEWLSQVAGVLTVTPVEGFHSEALPGGSFMPPGKAYILQNTGVSPIDWSATTASGSNAFLFSKTAGTLLPFQVDAVTVTVNSSYPFSLGVDFADTVYFSNITNTQGNTSRAVDAVIIDVSQGILSVTPADGFHSEAYPGGSFNPTGKAYLLKNAGGGPLNWTVTAASGGNAFLFSKTGGLLQPGQVDAVAVSVNESFPFTPGVNFADTVYFNNVTNTQGNTSRPVDAIIIDISQGVLTVTPARGFHSEALPGGPFNPAARAFVLQNTGGVCLTGRRAHFRARTGFFYRNPAVLSSLLRWIP